MGTILEPNDVLDALAEEHREWLAAFDRQHLRNWEGLANNDYEAAMTEASVRRMLQRNGVVVEPNTDLTPTNRQPDFRCSIPRCCRRQNYQFYVEATCISIEKATRITGLTDGENDWKPYGFLYDAVFYACQRKTTQCDDLGSPVLVAIGTFHELAARTSFRKPHINILLTGKVKMEWDPRSTTSDVNLVTQLRAATFLKPSSDGQVAFARSTISGLVLCCLKPNAERAIGVLHPNPYYRFNSAVLSNVEFGRVKAGPKHVGLSVKWPGKICHLVNRIRKLL